MAASTLSVVISLLTLFGTGYSLEEKDCPHPCFQAGHRYCEPIPCARPPCNDSFIPYGWCCPICPDTPQCPQPCTLGDKRFCGPIPCPRPPCDNPVTPPGGCCAQCHNGTDCPHPCYQGGVKYCHPIPCPLPPCKDHFVPDGACCPVCPNTPECPHPCGINGHHFCHPIPCPPPPPDCKHVVTPPGGCCEICNDTVPSPMPKRSSAVCPFPCEQGGQHYCYPVPCPHPPCVDAVTPDGACCPECPNGPNCRIEGHIYPAGNATIADGKVCKCTGIIGECGDILLS